MNGKRKVQAGALVVIANGFIALGGMSPQTATANSCNPVITCNNACSPSDCVALAPPGCTFSSCQLLGNQPACSTDGGWLRICNYS